MTRSFSFTVPGDPVPKARARTTRRGTFTPERTAAHTEAVQWAWNGAVKGHHDDGTTRYRCDLVFVCRKRHRADVDNLAKLVMDALNDLAWKDDSQVDDLRVVRYWSTTIEPHTLVSVSELAGP